MASKGQRRVYDSFSTCLVHLRNRPRRNVFSSAITVKIHVTGYSVGTSVLDGRHLVGILPVTHPSDNHPTPVRSIVKRHRCVMVLAVVHPFCHFRFCVASKLMTVKRSGKVLRSAAACRPSGIDVAYENPLLHVSTLHGQLEQVRTFPHSAVRSIAFAETTLISPRLQVGRRVYAHLLSCSKYHDPTACLTVPKDVRITEVGHIRDYHRIAFILGKGLSSVRTVGHALRLALARRRVERHYRVAAEARGIILIDYATAAENGSKTVCRDGGALVFPIHKVFAGRVSPRHVPPH